MIRESKVICIKYLFVVLSLIQGSNVYASTQRGDFLIFRGDTLSIYELLVEKHFQSTDEFGQGNLFGLEFREGASLNCWRGYQAIYVIKNDSLFLDQIISCGELVNNGRINERISKNRIGKIFGDKMIDNQVHVDWYSGGINLQQGDLLRFDGVFRRTFETEIRITVKSGVIDNISTVSNYLDNPKRIDRRYTDDINNIFFETLKELNWESNLDAYDCADDYLITINKKGIVEQMTMPLYDSPGQFGTKKEYNYCLRKLFRKLKKLKFDVIKSDGKRISEVIRIELWFDSETKKLENWTYKP